MDAKEAKIRLFGPFRNHFKQAEITVGIESDETLTTLKERIANLAQDSVSKENLKSLLEVSVFATEAKVLKATDSLPVDLRLALLPPVCGG